MKKRFLKIGVTVLVCLFLLLPVLSACTTEEEPTPSGRKIEVDRWQPYDKVYTAYEMQQIGDSSFRSLNSVEYPSRRILSGEVSRDYRSNVTAFSVAVYDQVVSSGVQKNFSFSPLGLYNLLHVASLGSNDHAALAALDALLGMTKEGRKEDYINAYRSDYYVGSNGTTQMYNAAFLTGAFNANPDYLAALSDQYVEAYSMNFQRDADVQKMLAWVDSKMGEKNFLRKENLDLSPETIAYLFSTVYFDNKWLTAFASSSTYEDYFYGAQTNKKISFMKHSYNGSVFDKGKYVSCYDYYCNGMVVKYIVPKELTDDVYTLVEGEDVLAMDNADAESNYVVNLSVPKFTSECGIDFTETLKGLGLEYLFSKSGTSFNYMFSGLPTPFYTYLMTVKQKNKVSFSEDGTVIKSTTYASVGGNTSVGPGMIRRTYDVNLNQPFMYVIYDVNGLPLYVGHVDMP